MNEQIKELAERANLIEVIDDAYLERNDWHPFVEQFAQLIVKECVDVCLESQIAYLKERIESDDFATKNILAEGEVAIAIVRSKIKTHFGIE